MCVFVIPMPQVHSTYADVVSSLSHLTVMDMKRFKSKSRVSAHTHTHIYAATYTHMHTYALYAIACPFMCPICSLCACLQPDKTPIHLGRILQRGDHCTTYVYSFDDLFDCNEVRVGDKAHTETHTQD